MEEGTVSNVKLRAVCAPYQVMCFHNSLRLQVVLMS